MQEFLTFISHSHLDNEIATRIRRELDDFGLSAFVAHEDIEPSEEWAKEIVRVAGECRIFLYLLTENFYNSKTRWPDHEIGMGISRHALSIPISLDSVVHVDPYGALAHIQKVKIFEESYYGSSFVVKSKQKKIGLAQFVLSKWHEKEGDQVVEFFIARLPEAEDFKSAKAICKTLRFMERWNWLKEEDVNKIVKYGLANNQVFNYQFSTGASDFIEELAKKYTGSLENGLLDRLGEKIQRRESFKQV